MNNREYDERSENITKFHSKVRRGIVYTALAGCLVGALATADGCNGYRKLERPSVYAPIEELNSKIYQARRVASKLDDLAADPFFSADSSAQGQFGLLKERALEQVTQLEPELERLLKTPEVKEYDKDVNRQIDRSIAGFLIFFGSIGAMGISYVVNGATELVRREMLDRKYDREL